MFRVLFCAVSSKFSFVLQSCHLSCLTSHNVSLDVPEEVEMGMGIYICVIAYQRVEVVTDTHFSQSLVELQHQVAIISSYKATSQLKLGAQNFDSVCGLLFKASFIH